MRFARVILFPALSLCLILSAYGTAVGQGQVTKEEVAQQVQQAAEKVKEYTAQQAEIYTKEMQAKLDEISKKADELRKKAASATGDAAKKSQALMENLKAKAAVAEQKLRELQSAGAGAWKDTKQGLDKAMADLQKAYDQAVSGLK